MTPDEIGQALMRITLKVFGDLWRSSPATPEEWQNLKEALDEFWYANRKEQHDGQS